MEICLWMHDIKSFSYINGVWNIAVCLFLTSWFVARETAAVQCGVAEMDGMYWLVLPHGVSVRALTTTRVSTHGCPSMPTGSRPTPTHKLKKWCMKRMFHQRQKVPAFSVSCWPPLAFSNNMYFRDLYHWLLFSCFNMRINTFYNLTTYSMIKRREWVSAHLSLYVCLCMLCCVVHTCTY